MYLCNLKLSTLLSWRWTCSSGVCSGFTMQRSWGRHIFLSLGCAGSHHPGLALYSMPHVQGPQVKGRVSTVSKESSLLSSACSLTFVWPKTRDYQGCRNPSAWVLLALQLCDWVADLCAAEPSLENVQQQKTGYVPLGSLCCPCRLQKGPAPLPRDLPASEKWQPQDSSLLCTTLPKPFTSQ